MKDYISLVELTELSFHSHYNYQQTLCLTCGVSESFDVCSGQATLDGVSDFLNDFTN